MTYLTTNTQNLYWLTRLDTFKGIGIALMIIGLVATFILFISIQIEGYDKEGRQEMRQEYSWVRKITIPFIIFGGLTTLFLPSRNEVIFIIAGGKAMDFVESDSSLNKIPAQSTKLITDYLENQIKDAKQ